MKEKLREYNFRKRLILLSVLTIILLCLFPVFKLVINEINGTNVYEKLFANSEKDLKVHFIDVGEGKAILINSGELNILIDTGDRCEKDKFMTYIKSYFNFHKTKTLDYLILTHGDSDHIGNVPDVCEFLDVKVCYRPKQFALNEIINLDTDSKKQILDSDYYKDAINAINKEDAEIRFNFAGEMIVNENFKIEFITPNRDYYEDSNDFSPIIVLTYQNRKFMFTGDASEKVENSISKFEEKIDVLDVAHHGSRYSSSEEFLKRIRPEIAVISVSKDNTYGHPSFYILERLTNVGVSRENILCSSELGTIVVGVNENAEIFVQTSGSKTYLNISNFSWLEYFITFEIICCFIVFVIFKPKTDKKLI